MGYSFRLAAWVFYMHHPRQDNTYHGLCYTSRGALAGTRNSSMAPLWRIDPTTHRTMSERSYHGATSRSPSVVRNVVIVTTWALAQCLAVLTCVTAGSSMLCRACRANDIQYWMVSPFFRAARPICSSHVLPRLMSVSVACISSNSRSSQS